ncbi:MULTISPECIES: phosphopentomutase [unclassified Aureimonas]|uniref:phosphopentomutase n=1 Tax=unclassified Aureimonas TaxID=2615206 RepID=UPI0006FA95CC|nr:MULTISPECIES: phosphopentomutase [unclassified Aureimonas]KQT53855.1 phosphopentomutase [Aureimonas sp. Leaf427]KQT71704.1 phosphopentomutase [Aureimonas sp. Leaf460]
MARAVLIVMDSFGIGEAPDAEAFGDRGADTFGHILGACALGRADREGLRKGPLLLPNLRRLGLHRASGLSSPEPIGLYGSASEISRGKDTPSGHWEIAGVPVLFDWGYFPQTVPAFPAELIRQIVDETGIPGTIGNRHASGTEIIEELGETSVRTGRPIFYTSIDSVLQIAAHEEAFGLERLYEVCLAARRHVDPLNIGRVIARPFVGEDPQSYRRTANRRDYAVPPPEDTLLDRATADGRRVIAIGKIGDIFAHRGISEVRKGDGNMALFDAMLGAIADAGDGDLVFANFIDFDSLYGHRRDVAGYAAALEAFDRRLPELEAALRPGDLVVITADHGCDPSFRGTDHTREIVPVLAFGPGITCRSIGLRPSFCDIGESVAAHLGLEPGRHGQSFLSGEGS